MNKLRNFTALGIGACGLMLLVAVNPVYGAEPQQAPHTAPFGHAMEMSQYYSTTGWGSVGEFPGTVECADVRDFLAAPVDQCAQKDHVYALSLQDGSMIYPLVAGDPQTLEKLPELVGKKVLVQGKYYESIGMIVAGAIRKRG